MDGLDGLRRRVEDPTRGAKRRGSFLQAYKRKLAAQMATQRKEESRIQAKIAALEAEICEAQKLFAEINERRLRRRAATAKPEGREAVWRR
jgi:hypothetical protein